MTVSPPSLFWYQLDVGTYIPTYFVQLDASVRGLCAANSVAAPPALLAGLTAGGYLAAWFSGTDTAVRALCTALSVTAPIPMITGQTTGPLEPKYLQSLDVAVRALCAVYQGPLDIVSGAVVAYGQRALSRAKLGTALYTIRRSSDDTTQSFSSDATTGAAPGSSISSFIGAGTGSGALWNDQSGNGFDAGPCVVGAGAALPQWLASQSGSIPAFKFPFASTAALATASPVTVGNAITSFAVGVFTQSGRNIAPWGINQEAGNGNGNEDAGFYAYSGGAPDCSLDSEDGAGNGWNWRTTGDVTPFFGHLCIFDCVATDAAGNFAINGTPFVGTNSPFGTGTTSGFSEVLCVGAEDGLSPFLSWDGNLFEVIVYGSALSGANRTAIRQNIAAYYGITLA